MPAELARLIINHGYLAIFVFVFSQEIGVPNPIPNELVIVFAGYLSYQGLLSLPLVILTVVLADFIGTNILYFFFYFFDNWLLDKKPKWLPINKIENLKNIITKRGRWSLYLGRLISYARWYVSAAAGLIGIPPRMFLTTVIWSSLTWGGGYALAGWFLGPSWSEFSAKFGFANFILLITGMAAVFFIISLFVSHLFKKNNGV